MKAVLLSIKPKYCELIARRKKIIEIRKTKPKLQPPFKCLIYCTKPKYEHEDYISFNEGTELARAFYGGGKIIGEFVCDEIYSYGEDTPYGKYYMSESELADCCISSVELEKYANGKDLYGWHISNLKIYDKPKELSEFCYPSGKYCEKGLCGGCPYDQLPREYILKNYGDEYDYDCGGERPLTRSPQSWCYVEEL